MILTILAVIGIFVGAVLLAVGVAGAVTLRRGVHVAAEDVWDSTETEVLEHFEALTGKTLVLDAVPIVPGRTAPDVEPVAIGLDVGPDWDVRRADFAAYIEQAKAAVRTLAVARRRRAIDAARTLTRPALTSIARPTQEFARIVAHTTGQTLTEVGPREAEIQGRRLVWTEQGWERDALMEMTT